MTGQLAYFATMDWQQAVSLSIVVATAAIFIWLAFRPRKFSMKKGSPCGCDSSHSSAPQRGSITFHARKGERPEIIVKMK